MTTSVGSALPTGEPLAACRACEMSGNVRFEGDGEGNFVLGQIRHGDTATYRYLNFDGENRFTATAKADQDMRVEVYIDGWYHASLAITGTNEYADFSIPIPPLVGKHTLQLKFFGTFDSATLSSFAFDRC